MISTNEKFIYYGYKVKRNMSKKGRPYITFLVGDKTKFNGRYINLGIYYVVCFQDLPDFKEHTRYRFTKISSIEKSKTSDVHTLVAEIELVDETPQRDGSGLAEGAGEEPVYEAVDDLSTFNPVTDDDIQF